MGIIAEIAEEQGLTQAFRDCLDLLMQAKKNEPVDLDEIEDQIVQRARHYGLSIEPTPCNHLDTARVQKYDGGNRPILCACCREIIGRWL